MTPFPTIQTARLTLRELTKHDAADIHLLRSDESVNRFLGRQKSNSIEEAAAFIEKIKTAVDRQESYYWVITEKNADQLIGTICLWNLNPALGAAEIGYELLPAFQGKGIMQEALEGVLQYAFNQLSLKYITACTHEDNIASTRLLVRNSFIPDTGYRFATREETEPLQCYYLANPQQQDTV